MKPSLIQLDLDGHDAEGFSLVSYDTTRILLRIARRTVHEISRGSTESVAYYIDRLEALDLALQQHIQHVRRNGDRGDAKLTRLFGEYPQGTEAFLRAIQGAAADQHGQAPNQWTPQIVPDLDDPNDPNDPEEAPHARPA